MLPFRFPPLLAVVWLVTASPFPVSGTDHSAWEDLLQECVEDGVVDYGKLKNRYRDLQQYLKSLETVSIGAMSRDEKMALFINAYNACCIRGVLDHGEIESVRDVPFFFKRTKLIIGGEKMSLDELENEHLRPMGDPRIHFAIVCCSKSCPSLRSEAYLAEKLDRQLDEQTRVFLNDPRKNRLDRENGIFYLSKIFKWFRKDFTKTHRSVLDFAVNYLDSRNREFLGNREADLRVKFLPYDWSLNGHY